MLSVFKLEVMMICFAIVNCMKSSIRFNAISGKHIEFDYMVPTP